MNSPMPNHLTQTPPAMTPSSQWKQLAQSVADLCVRVPVSSGPGALARELSHAAPPLAFREMLARGGWHRLGGVLDADGKHLANDLQQWANNELAAHDDDLHAMIDTHLEHGLRATRVNGMTHYLVASTGAGAADFLQVEIEELQEVVSHPLFDEDAYPANLEELLDLLERGAGTPTALAMPYYTLRRVTDIADFLARMREQKPDAQPVHRFLQNWEASSAGLAAQFSNHWVIAVREHLDRYRQPNLQAQPVMAINGSPPRFAGAAGAQGLVLHDALLRFDREAGYPMAWFFHMLTSKSIPHAVAYAVIDDVQAGFSYLPERDVKVLRDWLHRPYGF
jgi:hypothetical protein